MNSEVIIMTASLALQAVNVLLALRLILRTKRYLAGGVIISAVVLMTFRRSLSLYRYYTGDLFMTDMVAEIVALIVSVLFLLGILYATRIIESEVRTRNEKEDIIGELRSALAEIKTLKGIIPICASCKKIRDDRGYWNRLELYISEHSDAEFSHGICPDCAGRLYPDLASRVNGTDGTT
jgi:uncharacterized membrane protein (UPF0182 family)